MDSFCDALGDPQTDPMVLPAAIPNRDLQDVGFILKPPAHSVRTHPPQLGKLVHMEMPLEMEWDRVFRGEHMCPVLRRQDA
jgi:hypothetical protein